MSEILRGAQPGTVRSWAVPNVAPRQPARPAENPQEAIDRAVREGFDKGHREGRAAGEGEMRQAAARLGQLADSLARPLADLDRAVEQELLQLALAVARAVIGREPATDPQRVLDAIHGALGALPLASRPLVIRLHPDDQALVADLVQLDGDPPPRLQGDPGIARGGCRVDAADSTVDATLETRLATVVAELLDAAGDQRG